MKKVEETVIAGIYAAQEKKKEGGGPGVEELREMDSEI